MAPSRPPARPTILLVAFEPFGGEALNPAWEAVAMLHGRRVAGHRIVARCLPVAFGTSLRVLRAALRDTRPRLVLAVGQAGGRAAISLERVAINVDDARIPDNAGLQPIDEPVVPGGPAAYFTTLPVKAMLVALRQAGIPAEVSQTAGTYVCNHVFYGLMHALRRRPGVAAGFIHVPWSPAQAAAHAPAPGLPTETVVDGLRIALRVAATCGADARVAAGAEY